MMKQEFQARVKDPVDYLLEARVLKAKRQFPEYRKSLLQAVMLSPLRPSIWNELGKSFRNTNAHDTEALHCLQIAYALNPADVYVANDLAKFLTTTRKFDAAEKLYISAHLQKPLDYKILTAMGHMYQVTGRLDFAATCFAKGAELAPGDHYTKVRIQELRDDFGVGAAPGGWDLLQSHMAQMPPPPDFAQLKNPVVLSAYAKSFFDVPAAPAQAVLRERAAMLSAG